MSDEKPKFRVLAHGGAEPSATHQISEGRADNNTRRPYQPFGSDNLFPQAASSLARNANAHRSIMNSKICYAVGEGFDKGESKDAKLEAFVDEVNGKGETLTEVMEKVMMDYIWTGNGYLEIVENNGTYSFFHKDTNTCRVSWTGVNILIHPTWIESKVKKKDIIKIPLYPTFKKATRVENVDGATVPKGKRSIFHFKSYEPGFKWYGVPDWIAGMDAAAIAWKTNSWNVSRLDNDFRPSQIVIVAANASDTEAKAMVDALKKKYSGHKGAGEPYFIVKELGGEQESEILTMNNETEGDWGGLHKQSETDLILAHNWFRTLTSLPDNSGLSNKGDAMRTEYDISENTTTRRVRQVFLPQIKKIMKRLQIADPEGLTIISKPPVGVATKVTLDNVLRVGEVRQELGYEKLEDEDINKKFISENGNGQPTISIGNNK